MGLKEIFTLCGRRTPIHQTLSKQLNAASSICIQLPKYHSRGCNARFRKLTENLLFDRISPAEFRALYRELTGDESVSADSVSKEVDNRIQCIMHNLDPTLARDLRINNCRKATFDKFWDICDKVLEELTAVDERRHSSEDQDGDVIVNMAMAISAKDLHGKCKDAALNEGIQEDKIPSLSWFRLQFWPKNQRTHAAFNYTKRFNIRYMIQQRMIRKQHEDNHYCACIFKYVKEYATRIKDMVAFVCTDDKHKISVGEPGTPIAPVPRGKQGIVGRNEVFRVADHDFSKLSLIPTTILINEVPSTVDGSWYRGTPYVGVKVTALQSSTALRNAREIADCLILKYGSKEEVPPVLIVYCDGVPEHRTTFLSVKIAMIALSKFLNLDMLLLARTAPGHSWANPVEKINCILNLGLYGIGAMRTESSDVEFEASLKRCNGLEDIRKLLSSDECVILTKHSVLWIT